MGVLVDFLRGTEDPLCADMPGRAACKRSPQVLAVAEKHAAKEAAHRARRRTVHAADAMRLEREDRSGDDLLRMLYAAFEVLNQASISIHGYDIPLRHRSIFDTMTTSSLPRMYGRSYRRNLVRLLCKFEAYYFRAASLVIMPRRHGKSHIAAMWVACNLKTQPACTMNVYSVSGRQSEMFQKIVVYYLALLSPLPYFKAIKEKITVNNDHGTQSILNTYPANSDTLRGSTADYIICEEMAFIPWQQFADVIIPLMTVKNTAFIGISTQNSDERGSYFTKYITLKHPDGTPAFNIEVWKTACDECELAGVAAKCVHRAFERPPWIATDRLAQLLYLDDSVRAARELNNCLEVASARSFFHTFALARLEQLQNMTVPLPAVYSHTQVYFTLDPAKADSPGSNFGGLAWVFHDKKWLIAGIYLLTEYHPQPAQDILAWMLRFRASPLFSRAAFVIMGEGNYGAYIGDLAREMNQRRVLNYMFINTNRGLDHVRGHHTTAENKHNWALEFRAYMDSDMFRVWSGAILHVTGPLIDPERGRQVDVALPALWRIFMQQMYNLEALEDVEFDHSMRVKRRVPKISGKKWGPDDLAHCCLFLIPLLRIRANPRAWAMAIARNSPLCHLTSKGPEVPLHEYVGAVGAALRAPIAPCNFAF